MPTWLKSAEFPQTKYTQRNQEAKEKHKRATECCGVSINNSIGKKANDKQSMGPPGRQGSGLPGLPGRLRCF